MKTKGNNKLSRRTFFRNSSLLVAGTFTGKLLAAQPNESENSSSVRKNPKILNFNEKMHYRKLGKTGLMISEISLGGHWKAPWTETTPGWWWGKFMDDKVPVVPERVAKNRTEVVSYAIDAGMNYLDLTGLAECMAWGAALKGRRKKLIVGADDYKLCVRHDKYISVKDQIFNVDECLRSLGTDYLDIWRPQAKTDGTNTDAHIEIMLETYEKLKKEGKALHLGVSSHNRAWLHHVIEKYPQFEMVIFPVTAKTLQKESTAAKGNIEEVEPTVPGHDFTKSIFTSAQEHNVGVVTIKPFFGGSLFGKTEGKSGDELLNLNKENNDLARLTLQSILNLYPEAITSVIPAASTISECENNAMASYARPMGQTHADITWLKQMTDKKWASLPEEYTWLHDWEVI